MNISLKHIKNAIEYENFVKEFVTLLHQEFNIWEAKAENKNNLREISTHMPALISLVNTVGYLRGQDGIFTEFRPKTASQNEFYKFEDIFEKRLDNLIKILLASDQKDYYQQRLENYLVKSRTGQRVDII